MKKLLFISLISIIGCSRQPNVPKTTTTYQIDNYVNCLQVVVIDSCEYFYGPWGNATVLTHKGNCKNCLKHK